MKLRDFECFKSAFESAPRIAYRRGTVDTLIPRCDRIAFLNDAYGLAWFRYKAEEIMYIRQQLDRKDQEELSALPRVARHLTKAHDELCKAMTAASHHGTRWAASPTIAEAAHKIREEEDKLGFYMACAIALIPKGKRTQGESKHLLIYKGNNFVENLNRVIRTGVSRSSKLDSRLVCSLYERLGKCPGKPIGSSHRFEIISEVFTAAFSERAEYSPDNVKMAYRRSVGRQLPMSSSQVDSDSDTPGLQETETSAAASAEGNS